MIVAKNSSSSRYIYDNYAVDYERYERFEEQEKKAAKAPLPKKKSGIKNKLKLIALVLSMFCTGILIVGRYALIMNLNNQCKEIKNNIQQSQKENEQLNVDLLKFNDIKQVEKDATVELSMVRPSHANIVYLSVKVQNEADKVNGDEKQLKVGLLDKIVDFFN